MDDIIYNCMTLLGAVFSDKKVLPDIILHKYGLMELTAREIRKWFNMSDSGVYRRIKRWL